MLFELKSRVKLPKTKKLGIVRDLHAHVGSYYAADPCKILYNIIINVQLCCSVTFFMYSYIALEGADSTYTVLVSFCFLLCSS